jgi:hypothetical protein
MCEEEKTTRGGSENFHNAESLKKQNSRKECTFSLDKASNQPIMWPEVGESGQ